jgi:hypothetical protein
MCTRFSLLGERPYMDDSLLSDSMIVEQDNLMKNIDQTSASDLNLTQTSEQVDDLIQFNTSSDQINDSAPINAIVSPCSSTTTSIPKPDGPVQVISKGKKTVPGKKKRPSEMK